MLNFFRRNKKVEDKNIKNDDENKNEEDAKLTENVNQNLNMNLDKNLNNNLNENKPDEEKLDINNENQEKKESEMALNPFFGKKPEIKNESEKKEKKENLIQKEFKNIFQGNDLFSSDIYRRIVMNLSIIFIVSDLIILQILWYINFLFR